jgi:hypothetical protein
MKKFIFMVFSVSVFFLCVGSVVQRIESIFKPQVSSFVSLIPTEKADDEAQANEVRTFKRQRVIINNGMTEIPEGEFNIKLPPPTEINGRFELQRERSPEALPQSSEFPRVSGEHLIIIEGEKNKNPQAVEQDKTLVPTVKVFVDKDKKNE